MRYNDAFSLGALLALELLLLNAGRLNPSTPAKRTFKCSSIRPLTGSLAFSCFVSLAIRGMVLPHTFHILVSLAMSEPYSGD